MKMELIELTMCCCALLAFLHFAELKAAVRARKLLTRATSTLQ